MRALSCVMHRNYSVFYDHVYIRGIFRPIARESATKFVILSIIHARSAQYQLAKFANTVAFDGEKTITF